MKIIKIAGVMVLLTVLVLMQILYSTVYADSLSIGHDVGQYSESGDELIVVYTRPVFEYKSIDFNVQTVFSSDSDHIGYGYSILWSRRFFDISVGTGEYVAQDNNRQPFGRQYMVEAFYKITSKDAIGVIHTSNCAQLCPTLKSGSGGDTNEAYNWISYRRSFSF